MTKQAVERYFTDLATKQEWQASLADDMSFVSYTSPNREVRGKQQFLQAASRFYSMIRAVDVRELMVSGDRAVALTRYQLQPPNGGPQFSSDVAEVFTVRDGRISSLGIYFDTAPYTR